MTSPFKKVRKVITIKYKSMSANILLAPLIFSLLLFGSCEKSLMSSSASQGVKISFQDLRDSTQNGLYRFRTPVYIEGYMVSSDEQGHFFGKIVIQESFSSDAMGVLLATDLFETALWYPKGQQVRLYLKDLFADQKTLGLSVGGVLSSFGNLSIGRLPMITTQQHLEIIAGAQALITPKKINLGGLNTALLQTLVTIDSLQIDPSLAGLNYADFKEETKRLFTDPKGRKIYLNNSGYANFWDTQLPLTRVSITGVLSKFRSRYELEISSLEDVKFSP